MAWRVIPSSLLRNFCDNPHWHSEDKQEEEEKASESRKPGKMVLSENSPVRPKAKFELRRRYFHRAYLLPWILVILVPCVLRLVLFYDITFPFQSAPNAPVINRPEELQLYKQLEDGSREDIDFPMIKASPIVRPDEDMWRTSDDRVNADAEDSLKTESNHKRTGKEWTTGRDQYLTEKQNDQRTDVVHFGTLEGNEEDIIEGSVDEGQLLEIGGRIKAIRAWSGQKHDLEEMISSEGEDERLAEDQERSDDQRHFEGRQSDEERKRTDEEEAEDGRMATQESHVLEEWQGKEEKKVVEEREAVEAVQEKEVGEEKRAGEQGEADEKKGEDEKSGATSTENRNREERNFDGDEEQKTVDDQTEDQGAVKLEERTAVSSDTVDQNQENEKEEKNEEQSVDSGPELREDSTTPNDQTEGAALPAAECDLFDGDWEYAPEGPLYTNSTCFFIRGDHNCMSNGRPDTDFLNWRWKPRGCDLPRFEARAFMEAFRGKTIGFVGDSLARNQMQSMLCMLSMVEVPILVHDNALSTRWLYEQHQVTVAAAWSPFLLKESEEGIMGFDKGQIVVYLDVLDPVWTSMLPELDLVVLAVGQWYFKPAVYVMHDEVIGCHYCPDLNVTQIGFFQAYSEGLRRALEKVAADWKGTAILSTFASAHGERRWEDDDEHCRRERPLEQEEFERSFRGVHQEMRDIVWGEFNRIVRGERKKVPDDLHIDFLDVGKLSLLRADGHPGPFVYANPFEGKNPDEFVFNDCLHWCLPGPVDTWNQLLVKIAQKYL